MIGVDAGVEAGGFAISGRVGRAADRFEGALQGETGGEILCAFEEHVLEEMRYPGFAGRFVATADTDVDHHLGAVMMRHEHADDAQSVVESVTEVFSHKPVKGERLKVKRNRKGKVKNRRVRRLLTFCFLHLTFYCWCASAQQPGCFLGVVSDDQVGTGTFHPDEGLHHDPLTVDPALFSSGLDHRVFAGDIVGRPAAGCSAP